MEFSNRGQKSRLGDNRRNSLATYGRYDNCLYTAKSRWPSGTTSGEEIPWNKRSMGWKEQNNLT